MISQKASTIEGEKPILTEGLILDVLIPLLVVAIIGFVLPAIFWGIWYVIAGFIPTFLGFSRFWLDTIPGAFYAIIIVLYIAKVWEEHDYLSNDGEWRVSFWEFVTECPGLILIGLFLVISFVVSIFWSFASGLAACLALSTLVGICYGIRYLLFLIASGVCRMIESLSGIGGEGDERED